MKPTKLIVLFTLIVGIITLGNNSNKQLPVLNDCKTSISGKIIDGETKTPITDAVVILFSNGKEIKMLNVNTKGEYSFKLDCGEKYKIKVKANSYFKSEYEITTSKEEHPAVFKNFLLKKKCYQTITGKITNEFSNNIIDKATVTLYLNGEEIETTQVDKIGVYRFKVKCNSNYYLVVNKLNFINDLFEFSTSNTSNKTIKHNFILEPECIQTITGVIKNKITLEPISATLKLYLNNIEIESINVNNDGKYSVKFQCTTNYKIIAEKGDYKDDSYNFLTDYIESKQPDYFHFKKDLFLEPNECFQVVSGKIVHNQTKKNISEALISLYYQNQEIKTFKTNKTGSFSFNVKCDANYEIIASKAGLTSKTIDYTTSKEKGDDKTLTIYLDDEICNQIVNGEVIDKNTQLPITNAIVTLFENNIKVLSVITDKNGKYTFNTFCNTNYKIEAANSEYNSNSINFTSDKTRDATNNKTIELVPLDCNQVVNGNIIDKNTQLPITNAKVLLIENGKEIASKTTNENGEFSFKISCDTTYKIGISNSEYNSNSINFTSDKTRNATNNKTIELVPLDCNQIVNGNIIDKNTQLPIADAKVLLIENGKEIASKTTDENGEFSFNIDCDTTYKIEATNSEYNSNSSNFASYKTRNKNKKIQLELSKKECKQQVTGIIRDKISKIPLTNSTITLYQNHNVISTKTVDEDGVYQFDLKCSSTYKLSVFKNNRLESFRIKTAIENGRVLHLNFDIEPLKCVQYINGLVNERITDNAIPNAKVVLKSNNKILKSTTTDSNGSFYFEIECNTKYQVTASKINYTIAKKQINAKDKIGHPHNVNLLLEPIIKFKEKNGVKYIETKPINFELDEYELTKEAKIELNKVVFNLNQNKTFNVEVNYYTDSRGPDKYNMELTQKRADATKDYLVLKGVNPDRIKAVGYGETKLLNGCKNNVKCTDAEHAINRRTEFIVVPK